MPTQAVYNNDLSDIMDSIIAECISARQLIRVNNSANT